MECLGTLHSTFVVCGFYILLFVAISSAQFDECSSTGHRIIEDPYRSRSYRMGSDHGVAGICDNDLERGWYVFKIYGKFAEMPTECIDADSCGTSGPIWVNTSGQSLPLPGENKTFESCATLTSRNAHPKLKLQDCCGLTLPVIVKNCGDFFVYFLRPTPGCLLGYCVQEVKVRCKPFEFSVDGFAPCKAKYPTVVNKPNLSVAIRDDGAYLSSSYESLAESADSVLYEVTWYKKENERLVEIFAEETNKTIAFLALKRHIRMGDEILCKVSAFFSNTRDLRSPAVESTIFKAEIRISSYHLELVEDAESHKITFETTVPVVCEPSEGTCSIKIPLSVDKDEYNLHPDIAISECFVEIKSRKCSKRNCGKGVVYIKAVTDFVRDGTRVSNIRTGSIVSQESMWNDYTIGDITVSVKDVPGAQCYSFTDPHFITFDRLKYDFYKTGTYILHRSLNRDFEVNSRIWNCGGATDEISCNCGFVARENNDVISVDMCNGVLLETKPEVTIKSSLPLASGVKIKESKSRKKITVSFPSGAFVRADISEWGMSISVQVPSSDFNHTCGLCGMFDGDPSNDYHYTEQTKMDIEMKYGQANEFVELWRLRDGGLFNNLPEYKQYPKRRRFCTCEKAPDSTITPEPKCTRYDDVIRTNLIKSKDMTTKYKKSSRRKRSLSLENEHDLEKSERVLQHGTIYEFIDTDTMNDGYYFSPDDNDSDLRPVTPTWPTPTGITESQALEMCEKKLSHSSLAYSCSSALGSEMYIKDAIEMCVADLQLTDDFRWDSYAYTLIENECERALLENQTMWMQNDDSSVDHRDYLQKTLNCPYNCSGNGECTSLGCDCDDGFSAVDCSVQHGTPTITRIGDNGLCDQRTRTCDVIKVNVANVKKSDAIRCHFILLNTYEVVTEFDNIGTFRHKQTIFCPLPKKTIKTAYGPIKWAVRVSFNTGTLSNAVIVTIFDSLCSYCDWQGTCNLKIGSCFIERTCRSIGETSPANHCLMCNPKLNIYQWSIKEDNRAPIFTPPPPFFIFVGNTLQYQLEALDFDGDVTVYKLRPNWPIGEEEDISLSTDGMLLWQPLEAKQLIIPATATDNCGAAAATTIKVTVLDCPCKNGGKCSADMEYRKTDVVCICPENIKGPHCEGPYDLVAADRNPLCSVTCPKNTVCTINNECVCKEGWTGFGCRIALCRPDCQSGICVSPDVCRCYAGYTGQLCDKAICKGGCEHGGFCYAPNVCGCPSGYVGPRCETMTCRVNCQNGGYCTDPDTCVCPEGYTGPTCSQVVCQPSCMNGGLCATPSHCLCSRGYRGRSCQTGICQEACVNGGRCVRKNTCSCPRGFIGKTCEIPVCEPRCLNKGRCVAPNTCSCSSGWRGRHCQKAICNHGCRNGGVCIKPDVCACQQGYGGASCQTPRCRRQCMYGGRCIEPDRCACRQGYTGSYCERRSSSSDRYIRYR